MQDSTPPPILLRYCWICGRVVTTETMKFDEHGSIVHDKCDAARMKLKLAGSYPLAKLKPARRKIPD